MNTEVMSRFSTDALTHLRPVWAWWLAEITDMFPWVSAGTQRGVADTVFVDIDNDAVVLYGYERSTGSGSHALTLRGGEPGIVPAARKEFLDGATRVIARLPSAQVVRTEVTLPRAAKTNLRQVLGFEMDRHTPFNADQVYYDFAIKKHVGQQIVVDLVVVRRVTMDALLDKLVNAGITATAVDIDNGERSGQVPPPVVFNLLPVARSGVSRRDESIVYRWSAWILVGLAVVALTLPLAQRHIARAGLAAELESAREAAADVQQTRDTLRLQLQPMVTFTSLRSRSPRAIAVLDELTRHLPDNTWLSRLELSGQKVSMQGESMDAAALISILEQSELFSETQFASPITRNPSTQRDRFVIESKLETGVTQ
jgi:general secretion pathway protein L